MGAWKKMIKRHILHFQHAAMLCWVLQLSKFCVMGLFLAALKVVVCFQQSPNSVEKNDYFAFFSSCELGIKPGGNAAQMQWLEGVHNQITGLLTSSPHSGCKCVHVESPDSGLYVYMFTSSCCTPLMFPPFVVHSRSSRMFVRVLWWSKGS